MTPQERERHRVLTAELLGLSRGLLGVLQDAIRSRTFAAERATIAAAVDHAADISAALEPLDAMIAEESRRSVAAARRAAQERLDAHLRAQAEAVAAARERHRREIAEDLTPITIAPSST